MAALRLLAFAGLGVFVWMLGASSVPSQTRLPIGTVVLHATVTQPFGCTNVDLEPFSEWCPAHHFHSGVDLAAPQGTSVFSTTSGVASSGYDSSGAGNFVAIQFDRRVRLLYCHLASIRVRPGDHVEPGQLIGTVGATGLATGPHVHFEVDVGGQPIDPAAWLAAAP